MRPDDDPLTALERLPAHDLSPTAAANVRRRAQDVLARERRLAAHPWLAAGARTWDRALEPALAAAAVAAYLAWMIRTVGPLVS